MSAAKVRKILLEYPGLSRAEIEEVSGRPCKKALDWLRSVHHVECKHGQPATYFLTDIGRRSVSVVLSGGEPSASTRTPENIRDQSIIADAMWAERFAKQKGGAA